MMQIWDLQQAMGATMGAMRAMSDKIINLKCQLTSLCKPLSLIGLGSAPVCLWLAPLRFACS